MSALSSTSKLISGDQKEVSRFQKFVVSKPIFITKKSLFSIVEELDFRLFKVIEDEYLNSL